MRILILGAAGFIGRHVTAEILAAGHDVVGAVRRPVEAARLFPSARFVGCDLEQDVRPEIWVSRLEGIEIVVNVAGVFGGRASHAVHVAAPTALHAAAKAVGVRRIVLVSAISARADVDDDYARTKLQGERAVMESGLEWSILRPSLVFAKGSYGGTSLIRGLAAFPLLTPLPPGRSEVSPIHANDLARCVLVACETDRLSGQVLEPVGPQSLSVSELVSRYRAWLGFPPVPEVTIPHPAMNLVARIGDLLGHGPISTTGLALLRAGNRGDVAPFAEAVGFMPLAFDQWLEREPSDVQDRWHARLHILRPLVRVALVTTWLVSGLVGLTWGYAAAEVVGTGLGLSASVTGPLAVVSSVTNLAVAALLASGAWRTLALAAQLALVLGYSAAIGLAVPELLIDPFGALLKNIPILALILVDAALWDRR